MAGVFKCHCGKVVSSAQGLKSHTTRLHKSGGNDRSIPSSSIVSSQTFVKSNITCSLSSSGSLSGIPARLDLPSNAPSNAAPPLLSESLGSLLAQIHGSVRVIQRIPKGARAAAAEALSLTIDKCVQEKTEAAWIRLLLFAPVCFSVPEDRENRKVSLATLIKRNIGDFLQGKIPVLDQAGRKEGGGNIPDSKLAKRVEAKMANGDVTGAIRLMSSGETFAPHNEITKQQLLNLHPPQDSSSEPLPEVNQDQHNLRISDSQTREAINSFRPGSAGGLDMLRPQHLKDLVGPGVANAGITLLTSITSLCNVLLAGGVPRTICPVLYGASLCALLKKNNGIRPIAIGCVWRRLVAKMGSHHIRERLSNLLCPIQLGFGVRGGAEAAAHAARRYVAFNHKDPKVLLKIDFRNAFNTVDRNLMLQKIGVQFPELLSFLSQCYGSPTELAFGEELLSSERGIQQGDPLGPALFCMLVHPIASGLSSEMNVWYLDDAALGGRPETVQCDFNIICEKAAEIGLQVNFSKCELFCLGSSDNNRLKIQRSFHGINPDIQFPDWDHCTLLGAPLVPEAIEECLKVKCQALQLVSDRLHIVKSHVGFYLLKNTQAIPKLTYVLRSSPTWKCVAGLNTFDNILKGALEGISNTFLDENAWAQAALPVAEGGLGIRHASNLALPAFLASVHSVAELTGSILPAEVEIFDDPVCADGISAWKDDSGCDPPEGCKIKSQFEWEAPGVRQVKARLYEQAASLQDKARLLGVASKESGAFLNAIPSAPLGTLLDNDAFRIAVALRLGSKICQEHVCRCGARVDEYGIHGLTCIKSAGRRTRHSAVNDLLRRGLASANIPATLEPSYLSTVDNQRPDGITQIPWAGGKSLIWDFTCTNGLAPSHVSAAAVEPLYAAKLSEDSKRRKYAGLGQTYTFTPVAIECLGAVGPDSIKVLRQMGRKIAAATGEKRASEYLFQRISVAVQRGNASCITGTIPPSSSLDELFYII